MQLLEIHFAPSLPLPASPEMEEKVGERNILNEEGERRRGMGGLIKGRRYTITSLFPPLSQRGGGGGAIY